MGGQVSSHELACRERISLVVQLLLEPLAVAQLQRHQAAKEHVVVGVEQ